MAIFLKKISEEWEMEMGLENEAESVGRDGRPDGFLAKTAPNLLGTDPPESTDPIETMMGAYGIGPLSPQRPHTLKVRPHGLMTRLPALTTRLPALTTRLTAPAARAADNSMVSRPCSHSGCPTLHEAVSVPLPA